jgi:hypothetical protein
MNATHPSCLPEPLLIPIEVFLDTRLIAKGLADLSDDECQFQPTEIFDRENIEASKTFRAVAQGHHYQLRDWHRCERMLGSSHFHFRLNVEPLA